MITDFIIFLNCKKLHLVHCLLVHVRKWNLLEEFTWRILLKGYFSTIYLCIQTMVCPDLYQSRLSVLDNCKYLFDRHWELTLNVLYGAQRMKHVVSVTLMPLPYKLMVQSETLLLMAGLLEFLTFQFEHFIE